MDYAYSALSIKAIDDEKRTFSGTATTPTPDSDGDIIDPLGVTFFTNPAPLLLQHDLDRQIGRVRFSAPTAKGIDFVASIPKVDSPPSLKARVDEAWGEVKAGLKSYVSVRVRAREGDVVKRKGGGLHWLKSQITELSLVTIPANAEATIASVKSLDLGRPAATGTGSESIHTPGVSGTSRVVHLNARRDASMKTITEQLNSYRATRDAKHTEMTTMVTKSAEDGVTFDADQETTYDTLKGEVDSLNKHITRLEDLEKANKETAVVVKGATPAEGSESRSRSSIVTVKSTLDPGIGFARVMMCIAASKGSRSDAIAIAQEAYPNDPIILSAVKSAVGGATTSNNQGPAVQYTDLSNEFIEFLRKKTILDKFGTGIYPALTRVDFNTRTSSQTAGSTASWTGEGKPKPVSKGTFSTVTVDFHKIAVICALTKEEVRFSNPRAEEKIRNDMARAIAAGVDLAFIDPSNAGTANVKPAAITYNVAATAVSGTTAAALAVDLNNMIGTMLTNDIQPDSLVLIMSQGLALSLSLMRSSLGVRNFPDMTLNGGYLEGIPVIVSQAVTTLGSPTANMIVAVNASDIFLAEDGLMVDSSEQASLQMDDAPGTQDGTTGTGTSLVSLWQTNMLGVRAEREISWKLTRPQSVQYLSGVAYVPQ